MRALAITAHGSPLEGIERPDPTAGPGEAVLRVDAAGICRSDVHYRTGTRPVPGLPLVPGHEVAGTVVAGEAIETGTRVAVHYLESCGACRACRRGAEQFCESGRMVGLDRDGGYATHITVPVRNLHPIPDGVGSPAAAVMMCSTATSFHALRRGGLEPGESVAVLGAGGLGMSAIRLARLMGAGQVFAVDINPAKLEAAERSGAIPVDGNGDVVAELGGRVDVALELVGLPALMRTGVEILAPGGRAVAVGITDDSFPLHPFVDLVLREVQVIGAADHLADEVRVLLDMAGRGDLDVSDVVTSTVPLDVDAVNGAMDRLEGFGDDIRTVITPASS
jgi:2-desacetyl-2-hydroxyethyl bacteriochlorophyllide A dehydrogenase